MPAVPFLALLLLLPACSSDTPDDSGPSGDVDRDGDGYPAGEDCDDTDPSIHPDTADTCNEVDDDCDGQVDEDPDVVWFPDADDDGFGDPSTGGTVSCSSMAGTVSNGLDCDDADGSVHPGAEDVCDGIDQDCDGIADDDDSAIVDASAEPGGDGSAGAPFQRIQEGLDAGWTCLRVEPGTYAETVWVPGHGARIVGVDGPSVTAIDAGCSGRPMNVVHTGDAVTHVQGVTLAGGCESAGGGLLAVGSVVECENVVLSANQAGSSGGGVYTEGSTIVLAGVTFEGNVAGAYGGAIYADGSTLLLYGVTFTGNQSLKLGGAFMLEGASSMEGTGLVFDANKAYGVAVGFLIGASRAVLTQVDARANVADYSAGFFVQDSGRLVVTNAVFDDNRASIGYSSSVDVYSSQAELRNVTVTRGTGTAAVVVWPNSSFTMRDTIVTAHAGYGVSTQSPLSAFSATYSNVWGNAGGNWYGVYTSAPDATDISADPLFVASGSADPWDDDLHLRAGSPCENTGSGGETDPDGSARDMGAFGGPGGSW